ncbi:MAG: right-handed parallel beta-helix repeat-containing protein [Armatimonadota bacterium]
MARVTSYAVWLIALAAVGWQTAAASRAVGSERESPEKMVLYVSPEGSDGWSGLLAEPDAKGSDGPFRTIARAQREVRQLKAQVPLEQPVRVRLRGGVYFLEEPLKFTAEDSGAPGGRGRDAEPEAPVIYCAFPGERPVVSGGRRLTGWREEKVNGRTAWALTIPEVARGEWYFEQLFVNGSRRKRPRLPKEGFFRIEEALGAQTGGDWATSISRGSDRFVYAAGDLRAWRHLQDVKVTVLTLWEALHLKIKELDESKRVVIFDRNSERRMLDDFTDRGAVYYVENVFEELKEPGQWYLDRPTGTLYYLPLPGESIGSAEVAAPYLSELMGIEGEAEEPVRCLRFEGITFAHTEWPIPPGTAAFFQGSTKVPAAFTLRNVQMIRFDGCTFEHLGTHALGLADACWEVAISGCTLRDLGAGAVMVRDDCRRNTVEDCEIGYIGQVFPNCAAIMVGNSSGNKVVHNHIHHVPWMGVSVGWTWGYAESNAYGNLIEYNHIHDVGWGGMLSDIGGIYHLGVAPGTRIRHNLIHDVHRRGYGGWGIYLDEGSTDILVENNLVYRAESSGFHQHYGRDNLIRNNIFALNGERQIERTRQEDHRSFIFEQNIVYADGRPIVTDQGWGPENAEFARNLYWDASGEAPNFAGKTLGEWQGAGMDAGSVVSDPLFVSPGAGDFRLRPGSPALALGFKEFDLTTVGPRRGR